jgi:hypothetical protein
MSIGMNYKKLLVVFALFTLLWELSDPSTNFVRSYVENAHHHSSQTHDLGSDVQHFDNAPVLYSQAATTFVFDVIFSPNTISVVSHSLLTDQYFSSIFQPPKLS